MSGDRCQFCRREIPADWLPARVLPAGAELRDANVVKLCTWGCLIAWAHAVVSLDHECDFHEILGDGRRRRVCARCGFQPDRH